MIMKKRVVILTGAGISAESGISTFRDSDGLWEQYRVEDVATPEGYAKDKALVLDFYNQRRRQLKEVKPNEGHLQLVRLEDYFDVQIVTQNVDNLHEQAGSSHVLHLHGELTKARSERDSNLIVDIGYEDIHLGDKGPDGAQLRPHIVWFGEAVPNIEPAAELCERWDVDERLSGGGTDTLCAAGEPVLAGGSEGRGRFAGGEDLPGEGRNRREESGG